MNAKIENPKVFISYSWSSAEHEEWVLQLANELTESGVHVIIDKWDLREGADKYAYMEKMVTDESIRKVIIVCDRIYAEKADGRMGGVGTETQIISQEIYDQINQNDQEQKFVALISEKDDSGKPFIPTFLKSRIYIDMSDSSARTDNFEQLLRWIHDRPLHKRPEIGIPPTYLFEESKHSLGTTSRFNHAIDSLKQIKSSAPAICSDYFDTFARNLETFRITPSEGKEFDDQVIESIETFLPYRDEITGIFLTIARYRADMEMFGVVHKFFEKILPYGYWPRDVSSWSESNADNFKFILNELFIYVIAALLKNENFEGANYLLEQEYYFPNSRSSEAPRNSMAHYVYFNGFLGSLEHRKRRLNLIHLSFMSDLLQQRAKRHDLIFTDIMQADFVIFLRSGLHPISEEDFFRKFWWPHTLLYATSRQPNFEIFARAQSKRYFDKVKIVIGINDKNDLIEFLEEYGKEGRMAVRWQFNSISPGRLMNIDNLWLPNHKFRM